MELDEKDQVGQNRKGDTTETAERIMITGMFKNRESADKAYKYLEARGYTKDDVNVIMSEKTRDKYFKNDKDFKNDKENIGNKSMKGAGAGSAIGGTFGAVIGAIAAIGTSLLIPGLGLVIAGPLAAALAGAGAGGITGGLIGALIGAGIPEVRAKKYEQAVRDGYIVLGVRPRTDEDAEFIERAWRSNGGENIFS